MTVRELNIIDVTWRASWHWGEGHLKPISHEDFKKIILKTADRMETEYPNITDRRISSTQFTDRCLAEELWSRFGDVPMDPETECIEENWNGFYAGTFREDIWHWFEETFGVSVAVDLMKVGD